MKAGLSALKSGIVLSIALVGVPTVLSDNLPLPPGEARTPETRTLTEEEAAQVLERDWLFQAMGEPLLERAAKEIGWTRELAARLSGAEQAPHVSAQLRELDVLEKRLADVRDNPTPLKSAERAVAVPSWIWYPEGQPAADAPAESRYFRAGSHCQRTSIPLCCELQRTMCARSLSTVLGSAAIRLGRGLACFRSARC